MNPKQDTWPNMIVRGCLGGISGALLALLIASIDPALENWGGIVIAFMASAVAVGVWKAAHSLTIRLLWLLMIFAVIITALLVPNLMSNFTDPVILNVPALLGLAAGIGALIVSALSLVRYTLNKPTLGDSTSYTLFRKWLHGRTMERTFMLCCFGFVMVLVYHLYPLKKGVIPFEKATLNCDLNMTTELIAQGLDVNVVDPLRGGIPLHRAAYHNCFSVVQLLLEHGANVHARDKDGQAPLHKAASGNNPLLVELLLNYTANIDAQDWRGNTPLHIAVFHCNIPVIEVLLKHGANINMKNDNGETPLGVVMKWDNRNKEKTIEFLRQHGAEE